MPASVLYSINSLMLVDLRVKEVAFPDGDGAPCAWEQDGVWVGPMFVSRDGSVILYDVVLPSIYDCAPSVTYV